MSSSGNKKRINSQEIKQALAIYRYILPYKVPFIIGMVCLVVSTAVVSVIPMGFRDLVDASNRNNMSRETLMRIGTVLGSVLLLQSVLSYFRIYLFEQVSQNAMADIRRHLYEKIICLPVRFFENNRVGDLTSRISSDVTQLQDALSMNLAMLVRQLVLPLVCIPLLFMISVRLTLLMLAVVPVMMVLAIVFGRFIKKLSSESQKRLAEANVIVEETFQASDVVKIFTNEFFETKRFGDSMDKVVRIALHASKYRAAFVSFIIFAMFGAIVLIVTQGLAVVAQGQLSMGQLIEFLLYTVFIGSSLGGLSESYAVLQKTVGASERITQILEEDNEVHTTHFDEVTMVRGDVEFRSVAFSYPMRAEAQVFDLLSFDVRAGERVALVGSSGSGKSTVVKLLSRFYDVQKGMILVDGKNVQDFNLTALRKNIGMVPQEVILFGGTIRENITYGKTNATEQEIREAARKAYALDFIDSFPEKFETVVGERGMKLSGGQKQRIAIARALLRDPRILILDEATSALDSESEQMVKAALNELMKGRTTFIIAHRLSTIREADIILVLHHGKIVEQGNHNSLAAQNGFYSKLLSMQFDIQDDLANPTVSSSGS